MQILKWLLSDFHWWQSVWVGEVKVTKNAQFAFKFWVKVNFYQRSASTVHITSWVWLFIDRLLLQLNHLLKWLFESFDKIYALNFDALPFCELPLFLLPTSVNTGDLRWYHCAISVAFVISSFEAGRFLCLLLVCEWAKHNFVILQSHTSERVRVLNNRLVLVVLFANQLR